MSVGKWRGPVYDQESRQQKHESQSVSRDGIWEKEPAHVCSWAIKKYIVNNNKTDNTRSSAWILAELLSRYFSSTVHFDGVSGPFEIQPLANLLMAYAYRIHFLIYCPSSCISFISWWPPMGLIFFPFLCCFLVLFPSPTSPCFSCFYWSLICFLSLFPSLRGKRKWKEQKGDFQMVPLEALLITVIRRAILN